MNRNRVLTLAGMFLLVAGIAAVAAVRSSDVRSANRDLKVHDISRDQAQLAASVYTQNAHFLTVSHSHAQAQGGEPATRIVIPAIGLYSPVVPTYITGGVWQVADWAVGYLKGSALPGKCTQFEGQQTCATDLAAHDDIKGELFKNINTLKNGDQILIYTKHSRFTYTVSGRQSVDPTDGTVLDSPTKELVMITCEPYWIDTSRLVISARLTGSQPRR